MKRSLVKTKDGSHSLFVPQLDEQFHSVHGAIQESKHVFIEAGVNYFKNKDVIDVLEVGFGTGLNAFMTLLATKKNGKNVYYNAIEAYPLEPHEFQLLNYVEELKAIESTKQFNSLHTSLWGVECLIDSHFHLKKTKTKLEDFEPNEDSFDLIYFDAFAPSAQPELWLESIFSKMYTSLRFNGILVTYCAKGVVKRRLKSVGFTVESLPGPIGKREMTRAIKL